jgi:hypothetical protein
MQTINTSSAVAGAILPLARAQGAPSLAVAGCLGRTFEAIGESIADLAGVDLRDVQVAARDAAPRTTMRYDRARQNLDRHANYTLVAFMAFGT